MSEVFDIPTNIASRCLIDPTQYDTMYRQSIEQPDAFWSEQATTFLDWTKPWNQVSEKSICNRDGSPGLTVANSTYQ